MVVSGNSVAMTGLVTNLVNGITGFASDALTAIGQVVPVALPIFGAGLIIAVAVKTMKKMK